MNACRQGNAVFIGMIFLSLILLFKALIYLLSYRSEQKNVSVGILFIFDSFAQSSPNYSPQILYFNVCTGIPSLGRPDSPSHQDNVEIKVLEWTQSVLFISFTYHPVQRSNTFPPISRIIYCLRAILSIIHHPNPPLLMLQSFLRCNPAILTSIPFHDVKRVWIGWWLFGRAAPALLYNKWCHLPPHPSGLWEVLFCISSRFWVSLLNGP